jgi:hypothetical protein
MKVENPDTSIKSIFVPKMKKDLSERKFNTDGKDSLKNKL